MKKDMLVDLDNLKVGQVQAGKQASKEHERLAKQVGEQLVAQARATAGDLFVGVVDAGAGDDAKACGFAMEVLTKQCQDKAVLLLSSAGGKLAVLSVVPKSLVGRCSAKAWTSKVLDAVGGKDDTARGQSLDPSKLNEAVEVARSYSL